MTSSERAVLGAVLADETAYLRAAEYLQADDFHEDAHRLIWAAMGSLARDGKPVDLVTLSDAMERGKSLALAGGVAYVASLADGLPDPANVEHYARQVRDTALVQQLSALGMKLAGVQQADAQTLLVDAENALVEIAKRLDTGNLEALSAIVGRELKHIEHRKNHGVDGITTGYPDLDRLLLCFEPEDLVLLAARPGVGKTALALNIVSNNPSKRIVFFSLEMGKGSIVRRLLSRLSCVSAGRLRSGVMGPEDWPKLTWAQDKMAEWGTLIGDNAALTPLEMLAQCKRVQLRGGLDLVIVDYLQLMHSGARAESRNQEVSAISAGLKAAAKRLHVPVLALSQLSRAGEHRESKRPQLSDLRDSGSLEQDADTVVFLHPGAEGDRGSVIEVHVAKQRHGEIGGCKLVFFKESLRFESLAREAS